MKLVMFGPPGAGKGTIAGKLSHRIKAPHISTGDLFREAIKNETPLGRKVKAILDSGALVPDEVTVDLVKERLSADDVGTGFILDGFPRTIPQAEALSEICKIDHVLNFRVEDDVLISRLTGRRICANCGHSHHIEFLPPKEKGVCDKCGGILVQREDDMETAIKKRLAVYKSQTEPLIEYYRTKGFIVDIAGSPPPDQVLESVSSALSLSD